MCGPCGKVRAAGVLFGTCNRGNCRTAIRYRRVKGSREMEGEVWCKEEGNGERKGRKRGERRGEQREETGGDLL